MSSKFEEVVERLRLGEIETGLSEKRRLSWVKYCYHFSDIENIVSILSTGMLYSRNEAIAQGSMINDNASREVIDGTSSIFKDYVRFYFRPQTPTQFNNEGFRGKNNLGLLQAHCPFPIFLLFDIVQILNMKNTKFSEMSLAKNNQHQLLTTPEEFENLPFSMIYHNSWMTPEEKGDIISHRHAEIIVSNQVEIDSVLEVILVRSLAEMRTLLYLLPPSIKQKYSHKIRIDSQKNAFFGRWVYFEDVTLIPTSIVVDVNFGETLTVFELSASVLDHECEQTYTYLVSKWTPVSKFELALPKTMRNYSVKIYLDGHIAFADKFVHRNEDELPF